MKTECGTMTVNTPYFSLFYRHLHYTHRLGVFNLQQLTMSFGFGVCFSFWGINNISSTDEVD